MSGKRWKVTIEGTSPPLTVYERADRGNELYLKWAAGKSHKRPKLKAMSSVRGTDGKLDPSLVTRARACALKQYEEAKRSTSGQGSVPRNDGPPLTLKRGFDEVLAVPSGKYPSRDDTQWKTTRRVRDRVLSVLPPEMLWSELWPKHYRDVWRILAQRYAAGTSNLAWRAVEETVQQFVAASNWLGGDGGFLPAAPQPPKKWRKSLKRDWAKVTGERPSVGRPRHSPKEIDQIWKTLHQADPRLVLWAELGGFEYRGGQVIRGDRKDLDLTPGAGDGYGLFHIRGAGNKRGELVYLTPEQREAVDHALGEGYLSELEAAYEAGDLEDYPLWPGRGLVRGKARDRGTRMNRRTMLKLFKELEDLAGVPHQKNRGWYGMRRGSADRTRTKTSDERVKNAAGGWAPGSQVRAEIYENHTDPEVLKETARVRRLVRQTAAGEAEEPGAVTRETAMAALEALGVPPDKVEATLTLLGVGAGA